MNFDFEKTFHPQKEKMMIPKEFLEELSKELPDNMEYHYDETGHILFAETTEGTEVVYEGLLFKLTNEQKSILGNRKTFNDILTLIDNTQEPVEIVPASNDNTVIVNGKKIPFNRMVLYMPNSLLVEEADKKVYAFRKIEQKIDINLSNNKYSCNITLTRVPVKSIDYMLFKSAIDSVLSLSLKAELPIDTNVPISITIGLKPANAKTVTELVEAISLYNSFVDPNRKDGKVDGKAARFIAETERKIFDPYTELFWNKVLAIEKYTNSSFFVPTDEIDMNTVRFVDELYYSLVNKIPIRKRYKFESLDGNWDEAEAQKLLEEYKEHTIGVVISKYETKDNFFGIPFTFVRTKAGFDIRIDHYMIDNDITHLYIEKNSNSYVVEMLFVDEDEFNGFQKEHNLLEYMKDADSIDVIVERDDSLPVE